jgi:hypothetical protein
MCKGLEQIYGTQIKKIDSIDIWRKEVGFEQNPEEYLREMNVEFKLYTINELKIL